MTIQGGNGQNNWLLWAMQNWIQPYMPEDNPQIDMGPMNIYGRANPAGSVDDWLMQNIHPTYDRILRQLFGSGNTPPPPPPPAMGAGMGGSPKMPRPPMPRTPMAPKPRPVPRIPVVSKPRAPKMPAAPKVGQGRI